MTGGLPNDGRFDDAVPICCLSEVDVRSANPKPREPRRENYSCTLEQYLYRTSTRLEAESSAHRSQKKDRLAVGATPEAFASRRLRALRAALRGGTEPSSRPAPRRALALPATSSDAEPAHCRAHHPHGIWNARAPSPIECALEACSGAPRRAGFTSHDFSFPIPI